MSKELEALEKINHTICLNSPTIKWGIDTYDHIDCKDEKEFVKCYNIIEQALDQYENQDKLIAKQNECISDLIESNDKQEKEISALSRLCEYQDKLIEKQNEYIIKFYSLIPKKNMTY